MLDLDRSLFKSRSKTDKLSSAVLFFKIRIQFLYRSVEIVPCSGFVCCAIKIVSKCALQFFCNSLIVLAHAVFVDALCRLKEQRNMILSAEERILIRTGGNFFHCRFIVRKVSCSKRYCNHRIFVASKRIHDVMNKLCVVCTCRSTKPGSAPAESLRTFAECPVAVAAVSFFFKAVCFVQCCRSKTEINEPCRTKIAEHFSVFCSALKTLRRPEIRLVIVSFFCVHFCLAYPALN